jgi:Flp pilus assembly protein TadG
MRRDQQRRRGSNLVEGALTMVIFFTVMFAIFDFGRALNVYHALTDAAREGARYSVAPFQGTATLPTPAQVQTFTQNYLTAANVSTATVTVNQSFAGTVNGVPLVFTQVNVSEPYTFVFFPFTMTLSTSSVMRNETN